MVGLHWVRVTVWVSVAVEVVVCAKADTTAEARTRSEEASILMIDWVLQSRL